MKRISVKVLICSFFALLLFHPFAPAQEDEVMLTESQVEELNSAALASYEKAVAAFDRVLKFEGLAFLEEAAAADPKHVHLQLITAQIALQQARAGFGRSNITEVNLDESVKREINTDYWTNKYYQTAETCTQRVLDLKNLPMDLLDWAQNLNTVINIEMASMPRRREVRKIASYEWALAHSQSVMAYRMAELLQEQGGEGAALDNLVMPPLTDPAIFNEAINQLNADGGNIFNAGAGDNLRQPPPRTEMPPVERPPTSGDAPTRTLAEILLSLF